jgi:alcohol dehydrogenase (cytochrome c)
VQGHPGRANHSSELFAHTGKVLWTFQTGAVVNAPPVTYTFEGKQYIAVAAGSSIIAFGLN